MVMRIELISPEIIWLYAFLNFVLSSGLIVSNIPEYDIVISDSAFEMVKHLVS